MLAAISSWLPSRSDAASAWLASAWPWRLGALGVRLCVRPDPGRLGLGLGERRLPEGVRLGGELGLVAVGLGELALAERLGLGGEPGLVAAGLGERPRLVRLGVGRAADLGLQPLRGQFGLVLGEGGLLLDDLLLGLRLGERPGLRRRAPWPRSVSAR